MVSFSVNQRTFTINKCAQESEDDMKKIQQRKCDAFFATMQRLRLALSYEDVLLKTRHSEVLPPNVILKTSFSRNVELNIPIVSSPMDTVTEAEMAIALAEEGGIGILHKGLSPERQESDAERVKHKLTAFMPDPICIRENQTVAEVLEFVKRKNFKFLSFPVLNESGKLVGIITSSHFEFCRSDTTKISDLMLKEIISAPSDTTVEQAYEIMMKRCIKILPIFGADKKFLGIYTLSDAKRIAKGHSPNFNTAPDGTLRVGAAIGVGDDARQRMPLLAKAKVDVVVIDTAHGDSKAIIEALKFCKKTYPEIDVVVGNVSEPESALRLAKAGADGIRIGQGPGAICDTRVIAGVGNPQINAVHSCTKALRKFEIPGCADGGIKYSGDITKALAAGASNVMLGSLLAGTTEAPGEVIFGTDDRKVKIYRGMGSLGAMMDHKASRERYGQADSTPDKLVPEGVEGEIDFKGDVSFVLFQLIGGLRSGMGYLGAKTILELQKKADFHRLTPAGAKESHPHGLRNIKKAPNYG